VRPGEISEAEVRCGTALSAYLHVVPHHLPCIARGVGEDPFRAAGRPLIVMSDAGASAFARSGRRCLLDSASADSLR